MKMMLRCSLVWLFVTAGIAHGQSKPRIVLVLIDNLGYRELGAFGGILRDAPAPRLDKLARWIWCPPLLSRDSINSK